MVGVIVDRCSVAQDDYGDWWLEFYVNDIRHTVLVSDVAAQQKMYQAGLKQTVRRTTQQKEGNHGKGLERI